MTPHIHVLILTTLPADADGTGLATQLVEERLAACVNILPEMQSVYRWKGSIECDRERQVLIKTTGQRVDELRQRLAQLHPYDVPELVVIPIVGGSEAYLAWLSESTTA